MGVVAGLMVTPFFSVEAATLYMDPNTATLNRGDSISVSVRLDTDEEECINTVDAVITYTDNIVPVDTSRGSSILSVWLEEPVIDKVNRTITFAGGIPNGYCGRIIGDPRLTNHIIDLVFSAPGLRIGSTDSGDKATIAFGEGTRVLLNDGFGTDASLRFFDANIEMAKTTGPRIINDWAEQIGADDIAPEKFSISLERTSNAFSNRYFIVFNTTDKQSGIDYYEVIEEPLEDSSLFNWGAEDAPWVKAKSPYVLKDQSLNSTIRVRAYDKAGNEYIATLVPEEGQRTLSNDNKILIALIVAGVLSLLVLVVIVLIVRRRRRSASALTADDNETEDEE